MDPLHHHSREEVFIRYIQTQLGDSGIGILSIQGFAFVIVLALFALINILLFNGRVKYEKNVIQDVNHTPPPPSYVAPPMTTPTYRSIQPSSSMMTNTFSSPTVRI